MGPMWSALYLLMCWDSPLTAALPRRNTSTELLRWYLENLAFCLAFGLSSLPHSCWGFRRASSGPFGVLFSNMGRRSRGSPRTSQHDSEKSERSCSSQLSNLLVLVIVAEWSPYLCFTVNFTASVIIALLSWCHGRLRSPVLWGTTALGTYVQCTFIVHASILIKVLS